MVCGDECSKLRKINNRNEEKKKRMRLACFFFLSSRGFLFTVKGFMVSMSRTQPMTLFLLQLPLDHIRRPLHLLLLLRLPLQSESTKPQDATKDPAMEKLSRYRGQETIADAGADKERHEETQRHTGQDPVHVDAVDVSVVDGVSRIEEVVVDCGEEETRPDAGETP